MKKVTEYKTLSSLVEACKEELEIEPKDVGLIIILTVRGEESYSKSKFKNYNKYHYKLAYKLRDSLYSVFNDIKKKTKDFVLNKLELEARREKNLSESGTVPPESLNWWHTIYRMLYETGAYNKKDSSSNFHNFLSQIYSILVDEVSRDNRIKSSSDPLTKEYDLFITKFLNTMRGHK